ncbi:MAG: VCBS repeat-containing protein, partial [Candidatus Latescibacteria bacterium]|nr:VCBS repeat-containing protein [Candidatus Latescibacterota bacterium]
AVADVEADGDIDIFVTNVGANALLLQSGGHFTDQAVAAGAGDTRWGTATAFFDADNDGDLDLAVINYVPFCLDDDIGCRRGSILTYCDPERYDPTGDLLYRN